MASPAQNNLELQEDLIHHRRKAQSSRADVQILEGEFLHHRFVDQNWRKDHIRAELGQAWDFLALSSSGKIPQNFPMLDDLVKSQNSTSIAPRDQSGSSFFSTRTRMLVVPPVPTQLDLARLTIQRSVQAAGAPLCDVQKIFQPIAAEIEFSPFSARIARRKSFHQSHRAERKAVGANCFSLPCPRINSVLPPPTSSRSNGCFASSGSVVTP